MCDDCVMRKGHEGHTGTDTIFATLKRVQPSTGSPLGKLGDGLNTVSESTVSCTQISVLGRELSEFLLAYCGEFAAELSELSSETALSKQYSVCFLKTLG